MKKLLKLTIFSILSSLLCAGFVSCSDDEDIQSPSKEGYYVTISCSGGGLSSSDLRELEDETENYINDYAGDLLRKCSKNEAIIFFDAFVEGFCDSLSDGIYGLSGTLKIKVCLKSGSSTVKSQTVCVTSYNSYLQ